MKLDPNIKAVCFDAFGTLVEIKDKRRSHAALFRHLDTQAKNQLKHVIMREPLSVDDCVQTYAHKLNTRTVQSLKNDLAAELASITLRPQINKLWDSLNAAGYKVALCSNLALSYGPPLLKKLPGQPDALILSYETGFIKPEPEIYQLVCDKLSLPAEAILFSGDTQSADIEGPKAFGMQSLHIDALIAKILLT